MLMSRNMVMIVAAMTQHLGQVFEKGPLSEKIEIIFNLNDHDRRHHRHYHNDHHLARNCMFPTRTMCLRSL